MIFEVNKNMIWLFILFLLIGGIALFLSRGFEEDEGGKAIAKLGGFSAIALSALFFLISTITIIRPGYVGVQTTFGTINPSPLLNGVHLVNPLSSITDVEIRTFEYTMSASIDEGAKKGDDSIRLFSSEGLPMDADITLIWRPAPNMIPWLYQHIGTHDDFVSKIIRPSSRSALRDSVVKYTAKEAITSSRDRLAVDVKNAMEKSIDKILAAEDYKGGAIVIQDALIRNIEPPEKLKEAIQFKLVADQESQRMQFVLSKELQEAKRKTIEAQGIADFQRIVTQGISEPLLQWKGIEATLELAKSPNAKVVVIGSGKNGLPIILGQDGSVSAAPKGK
jgi:regulator of protease activity HflC (stomatin/prohibitin superfamily)